MDGNLSFIMANKLKALKVDLKKWNEIVFRYITIQKNQMWAVLSKLEVLEESRS